MDSTEVAGLSVKRGTSLRLSKSSIVGDRFKVRSSRIAAVTGAEPRRSSNAPSKRRRAKKKVSSDFDCGEQDHARTPPCQAASGRRGPRHAPLRPHLMPGQPCRKWNRVLIMIGRHSPFPEFWPMRHLPNSLFFLSLDYSYSSLYHGPQERQAHASRAYMTIRT